jgi:hypothetical protein
MLWLRAEKRDSRWTSEMVGGLVVESLRKSWDSSLRVSSMVTRRTRHAGGGRKLIKSFEKN